MAKIRQEVRDINRLREILTVLIEEGFGFIIDKIKLKIPKKKIKIKKPPEVRLRRALERLGPTFIKLGQILSTRPDILPLKYLKELEKLQDRVKPLPFKEIKRVIETELGPIDKIFTYFEKKPIASASISQIHKAKLNNNLVVVKVQRPNIETLIETDIEIMFYIAKLLERYNKFRVYKPLNVIEEFARWTRRELDFRKEAANINIFKENFKKSKYIYIPTVYNELVTKHILVLEYLEGTQLHNIKKIKQKKLNFKVILQRGFEAFLTQVFVHGIFHADPHPANIIILDDGRIAFVDFGIVGRLDNDLKKKCLNLFIAIVNNDIDEIANALADIGKINEVDDKLKSEIKSLIEPLQNTKISELRISVVLEKILDIAFNYNIRIPRQLILFGKTLVTLEGVALEYDPNFNLIENSRPFIEKLIKRELKLSYIMKGFIEDLFRFKKFIKELPDETTKALKKIQEGTLKIDVEDTDIKKLSLEISRSSNRLAYSMVIAALIIAGAFTINVSMPKIWNLSMISFICFLFAIIFGLVLFISIYKERKIIR